MRSARIVVPHSSTCFLKDQPAPFVLEDGIDWNLNHNAVGKGGTSYYRFRCNDPGCPAILRVGIVALSQQIWKMFVDEEVV